MTDTSKPERNEEEASSYWEMVLQAARRLPEVEEGLSYGTPALRVRGRFFCRLWENGETLVVRVDFDEREALLHTEPDVFFLTDHYRGYPAVLIHLSWVTAEQLAERLEAAWRMMAPKRLVSAFDAHR